MGIDFLRAVGSILQKQEECDFWSVVNGEVYHSVGFTEPEEHMRWLFPDTWQNYTYAMKYRDGKIWVEYARK